MTKKDPYQIIKHQHVTEKSKVLENLHAATSNKCLERCKTPKYVFIVDKNANKFEIAHALEEIYQEKNIQVVAVNTINVKPRPKRRARRQMYTSAFKKAIVTLREGDSLDNE